MKLTPNLYTIDPSLKMNAAIHVPLLKDLGSTSPNVNSAVGSSECVYMHARLSRIEFEGTPSQTLALADCWLILYEKK